jgi:hypothetical protein
LATLLRRSTALLQSVPIYPAALVAAFVIAQFAVWWPPVIAVVRPLGVVVALSLAAQLIASRFLGRQVGAMVAAVVGIALLEIRVAAVLAVAMLLSLAWLEVRRRRTGAREWSRVTRSLNVIALGALAVALISALTAAIGLPAIDEGRTASPAAAPADAPDIYLILLDGYPRADALADTFGLDNEPFIDEMATLGFDSADQAHSNYNRTALTVPSVLNAAHIDDLMPQPPAGFVAQNRWISSLINRASAVEDARALGYDFVHVPTDVQYFTRVANTDLRDTGQLSQFEMTLVDYGLLRLVAEDQVGSWHRAEHRDRIVVSLDEVARIAGEPAPAPRLVFAHIALPHYPLLFRADGSESIDEGCFWYDCDVAREPMPEDFRSLMREQIEFTNQRTLVLVRLIIEDSQRPVVILVWSDHGFRHWLSSDAETFRSVVFSRTPDHPNLFPENASPLNLIPRVLNAYLDAGLPLAREDVWYTVGSENGYFPFRAWDTEPQPE